MTHDSKELPRTPISPAATRDDLIAMIHMRDALVSDLKEAVTAGASPAPQPGMRAEGEAHPTATDTQQSLTPEMVRLVLAARHVAFVDHEFESLHELDEASEAFADVVPWDDDPNNEVDRLPAALRAPAVGVTREAIARAIDPVAFNPSDKEVTPNGTGSELYHHAAMYRREQAHKGADRVLALRSPAPDATASEPDPLADLVSRFSKAVLAKLRLAQANGQFRDTEWDGCSHLDCLPECRVVTGNYHCERLERELAAWRSKSLTNGSVT